MRVIRVETLLTTEIEYGDPLAYFQPFSAEQGAVLLHSAKKMLHLGRYSYIAIEPFAQLTVTSSDDMNAFDQIEQQWQQYQIERVDHLPPFQGGAMGMLSYELLQQLEDVPVVRHNDLSFPLAIVGFYDLVVGFDHEQERAWVFSSGLPECDEGARKKRAQQRMDYLLSKLIQAKCIDYGAQKITLQDIQSNFSYDQYIDTIQQTIDYIFAGDIFEANIAQRFYTDLPEGFSPWHLFTRSCAINPATFASYLNFGDVTIASASPERFIQCEQGTVECRPIKGTRARSDNPAQDLQNAQELCASVKDRAENIMIVDLMRNDIAQVCVDESVRATQLCGLESYATVHHLVSVVEGQLESDKSAVDLFKATFPGGSITGAPKIRTMQIISELEPHHRGPYCGNVFCLGFDGFMDSSITIRTFAIRDRTKVSFHTGGAIVADSDPAQEYQESLDKAFALKRVLTQVVGDDTGH